MKTTPDIITELEPHQVFVFGSNRSGAHIGGAAKQAMQWGARFGEFHGLYGQTYAIPTKGHNAIGTLPIMEIRPYVNEMIREAKEMTDKEFLVTEIGCGIAGLTPEEVAPLFSAAMDLENVVLPERFIQVLKSQENTIDN